MEFEWDEQKRLSNVEKHGIDFVRAKRYLRWETSSRFGQFPPLRGSG